MLQKSASFKAIAGPIVTIVLDGVGITERQVGNAVAAARKPTLDHLFAKYPYIQLKAHGTAVGMPSDADMGNSEVGHNAIGSGQVYTQGAALVSTAIENGELFRRDAWKEVISNVQKHSSTLHFLGLFSDGNVHSHIHHLKAMIVQAKAEGVKKVRIHALLDGRDVPETSALEYVGPFEQFLKEINTGGFDAAIASGGGRMRITMDRYGADWPMVSLGWKTHVRGEGEKFASATDAITKLRERTKATDQNLDPFVIAKDGVPIGPIVDDDSVVFFNFRGDRAIEITQAFCTGPEFNAFERGHVPRVCYAGMLEYDGDLKLPKRFLVPPPAIKHTLGEALAEAGISQFAISETQKYGHVTYFWNGNRSGKFDDKLELYQEIPSDVVPFEQRPWMKAAEITDALIKQIQSGKQRTLRVNYANGDMVGHTGSFQSSVIAIETLDIALARLLPVVDAAGGVAIITADHGNADEMFELDKKGQPVSDGHGGFKAKTSHTLNPVPCILYDNQTGGALGFKSDKKYGLSSLAATTVNLLGYEAPSLWDDSLLIAR
ncbi:MAG TPA: 2,3-bisphosphoglycerate-independent phosphoglycerate mutase [Polyangiaceae bacterium]|nr:2,3-bisphosphoglycerate-independent phosphoglycerate mutase [Polyangiaceae bacterium]